MAFGNGSDGDVIISANTTLTSDMNYNNLTVNAGVTLNPDGYVIYVKDTLSLPGIISRNGNNGVNASGGTGGVGGAALPTRSVGGSAVGGKGGNTTGFAGGIITDGIAKSSGGAGGNTGLAGGAGGTTTNSHTVDCKNIDDIITNAAARMGGPGGGGGAAGEESQECSDAGGTTGGGGGGGSGAGVLFISAKTITNTGGINANGGAGGNGAVGVDCPDGVKGGGGGGGAVIIEYANKDNYTGTVSVTGGTGANAGTVGTITYCLGKVTISGNVKDNVGYNLLDVSIELIDTLEYSTLTDSSGNYSQVVDPDVYTVTVSVTGNGLVPETASVDASSSNQTQNFVLDRTTVGNKGIRLRERYLSK